MIQLYFLSILCNCLCGYILFSGDNNDAETSIDKNMRFSLNNPAYHLILGIVTIFTGVMKLLSPTMGTLPILGDLVPSLSGICAGLLMIFGIYRRENAVSETSGTFERLCESLLRFRKQIGIGLFVIALLHFLFPTAFFI